MTTDPRTGPQTDAGPPGAEQAGAASGPDGGGTGTAIDERPEVAPQDAAAVEVAEVFEGRAETLGGYVRQWWQGVRAGEIGSLPIIVGLIVIAVVFGTLDDTFFTERNFTNLLLQMAYLSVLAIGTVFVLLLGEIDLSVAFVSGVGGVMMTLLLRPQASDWPWWLAIAAALVITTVIGLLHGLVITKAGVPSFVVTLAGLLVWSGVVLILTTEYSTSGTIRIQDETTIGIANNFLSDAGGWIVGVLGVVGYAVSQLVTARSRLARGLSSKPLVVIALQVAALAAVVCAGVATANQDRGVPQVVVLVLVVFVFWSFIAARTRFGRHVYAVGGNAEAARRAGINVDRIRIAVFMIAGLMAGLGGIILASRLRSVATNTGGGNLLLNVIAAAVIGGTSLFGGRGRVVSALLGALVITAIDNGMGLLNLANGTKFVITGLVLLAAVLVDALSTRRRAARGVV
jgi:D-xylose transport system permease protein